MDALYQRGFAAGVQAAKEAVQRQIDTSAYGYVAWKDVLAAIDWTLANSSRDATG